MCLKKSGANIVIFLHIDNISNLFLRISLKFILKHLLFKVKSFMKLNDFMIIHDNMA